MGLIRIRKADVDLALDSRLHDPVLDESWKGEPERLKVHYRKEWERYGVKAVYKSTSYGRLSKMTTTYYRKIRLGTGYAKAEPEWQAVTDAHETVHVRQWRRWGRNRFRTRYLFWTRWRWAIEVQAYAESVRALVALGASESKIRDYITRRPKVLWDNYALKSLRKNDVYSMTIFVLQKTWDDAKAAA